ncbi:SH3 domain-containing protein [Streptomyces sp. XM83C]|uniref:SH3 domain-containing protein n=1 Tax=unclassified Streptomyces TaxID=2593676 RepID=UPI001FFBB529|nr:SH3 domain-containing protein [Streptomyces sp. XM83C]MCK1823197.1 SH3 domain-containing protein [Streptomyces sp. XM83C]
MRTTPALRILAAALLTGGTLAVATTGTTAAAAPPTFAEGHEGNGGANGSGPVWGTVTTRTELNVRQQPTTHSSVVASLDPGTHVRVQCKVLGQSVNGNPYWYWLSGTQGWASAAFVDVRGARVPTCADPCPQWRDGWRNADSSDPEWNQPWAVTATVSVTVSGSWTWTVS